MTDNELKFFDPETGAELHRVPDGAMIPEDTPFGDIKKGKHRWHSQGFPWGSPQEDDIPRFTREPIAPPKPPLPTEPGYYLDKDGGLWELWRGEWGLMKASIRTVSPINPEGFAPFTPATIVPTETWDRLRVLAPEDARDRVDRDGDLMRIESRPKARWGEVLATVHWHYGPLRFADEVSDDE